MLPDPDNMTAKQIMNAAARERKVKKKEQDKISREVEKKRKEDEKTEEKSVKEAAKQKKGATGTRRSRRTAGKKAELSTERVLEEDDADAGDEADAPA